MKNRLFSHTIYLDHRFSISCYTQRWVPYPVPSVRLPLAADGTGTETHCQTLCRDRVLNWRSPLSSSPWVMGNPLEEVISFKKKSFQLLVQRNTHRSRNSEGKPSSHSLAGLDQHKPTYLKTRLQRLKYLCCGINAPGVIHTDNTDSLQ